MFEYEGRGFDSPRLHMSTFKHTHLSTRYDRPVDTLQKVLERYIETSDIITLTEVDSEKREKVIRSFPKWASVTGDKTGRDDCAIMWHDDEWEVIHKETHNVGEYMAGNIAAAYVVLKHVHSTMRIVVSVVHLPSSVQGQGRVVGGRAPAWFTARRRWVRRAHKLKRQHRADAILLVADWNIDLKRVWVRSLIKTLMPSYRFVWRNRAYQTIGTHGSRLIDFSVFKGKLRVHRRPDIHKITSASDHRGYDEVLAFTS